MYRNYAKKGLFELLEYIAFVKKDKKNYIINLDNLFQNDLKDIDQITVFGVLFTDYINNFEIEESENIKLIKFE